MQQMYRSTLAVAALLGLAGCGGSGTVAPQLLTRADVGGVYSVCELNFQPTGLPAVDLLTAATERNPNPPLPAPNLKLSTQANNFELEYTPLGDVLPRRFTGSYLLGRSVVTLQFTANPTTLSSALLLPVTMPLEFDSSTNRLSAAVPQYTVTREDYGRLAGLTQEQMRNLQQQIEGTLTGHFARESCS